MTLDESGVTAQVGEQEAPIRGLPLVGGRRIEALGVAGVLLHAWIVSDESKRAAPAFLVSKTGSRGPTRRPMGHTATTACRSLSAAPLAAGVPSGTSARACDSLAYSVFERPSGTCGRQSWT